MTDTAKSSASRAPKEAPPERVYLQDQINDPDGIYPPVDMGWNDTTWVAHRVNPGDVEYVRADLALFVPRATLAKWESWARTRGVELRTLTGTLDSTILSDGLADEMKAVLDAAPQGSPHAGDEMRLGDSGPSPAGAAPVHQSSSTTSADRPIRSAHVYMGPLGPRAAIRYSDDTEEDRPASILEYELSKSSTGRAPLTGLNVFGALNFGKHSGVVEYGGSRSSVSGSFDFDTVAEYLNGKSSAIVEPKL